MFSLTIFLGACIICSLLDFLFPTETVYQLSDLSAAAIAAIAGGSALVSGVGSLLDSASTNKANKEINAENREWQSKENEKSRLWSERMWKKEFDATNEYNDPLKQKQRLMNAGYNPYLVNGQVAGSNTAFSPSTPSDGARGVPSAIPVQRSDYSFVSDAGRRAADAYMSVKSVDANVANQSKQTESQIIDNAKKIYQFTGDKKQAESYMNRSLSANNGAPYNMNNSPYARQVFAEADKAAADADYSRAVADLKMQYGEKEIRAALRIQSLSGDKLKSELLSLAKDRDKTDAEISKIMTDKIVNYAKAANLRADTTTINATRQLIVEKMSYENKLLNLDTDLKYNEVGESNSRFVQRQKARDWMRSEFGKENALHNQVTENNEALYRLDRIVHAVSPMK